MIEFYIYLIKTEKINVVMLTRFFVTYIYFKYSNNSMQIVSVNLLTVASRLSRNNFEPLVLGGRYSSKALSPQQIRVFFSFHLLYWIHFAFKAFPLFFRLRSTSLSSSEEPRTRFQFVEVGGATDDHYANVTTQVSIFFRPADALCFEENPSSRMLF